MRSVVFEDCSPLCNNLQGPVQNSGVHSSDACSCVMGARWPGLGSLSRIERQAASRQERGGKNSATCGCAQRAEALELLASLWHARRRRRNTVPRTRRRREPRERQRRSSRSLSPSTQPANCCDNSKRGEPEKVTSLL